MQERSERTLRRLVLAAAVEFDRGGYARTTLDDITRSAGVTKGALYFHFSSKDALADAVQLRGRSLLDELLEDLRQCEPSPLQTLIDTTHRLNRLLHEEPVVRASVRITRERGWPQQSPLDFYGVWLGRASQLLREAREDGELDENVGDASARALIASVVSGVEVLSWTGVPYREASESLTALWDLLLPALVRGGGARRFRTRAPETADR